MRFSSWTDFPLVEPMLDSTLERRVDKPGDLHLSTVLKKIMEAEGEAYKEDGFAQQRFLVGYVWETALEYMLGGMSLDDAMELAFKRYMRALRADVSKQVRLVKDGIHMTPDALDSVNGVIESYKSTARSLAKAVTQDEFEGNFQYWLLADSCYALAAGVDTVRYIVLWRSGDYSRGAGTPPMCMEATVTWTPEELKSNWERVLRVRDQINETEPSCSVVRTLL